MSKTWKRLLGGIGALVVIGAGVLGFQYYQKSSRYLSTNDAYVSGRQIVIAAPASGKIVDWAGKAGTSFSAGSTVGDIQTQPGNSASTVAIPVPQQATIVQRSAVNGEFVGAGTPLAYAYNLHRLWVTVDLKETVLRMVAVGAPVTIHVDAYPNTPLTGTVRQIEPATASTFSLIPTRSLTANFTKVTQVIPVRVSLHYSPLVSLVPGMDVSVTIKKEG